MPSGPATDGSEILGDAAPEGYEVIGQQAQTVPPGDSATFPVRFEGEPAAVLWVLPGGEGITPSYESAEFSDDELFGATAAVAAVPPQRTVRWSCAMGPGAPRTSP